MFFEEIKTEYDYFTLSVYGREFKLLFRIRQYKKLKNQTVDYIKKIKRSTKVRHYKRKHNDGTIEVVYYKPYCTKLVSLRSRKLLMKKIFALDNPVGINLGEEIIKKWENINCHKITATELMDKEAMILDIFASYYLGGLEGSNILNQKTWRKIKETECLSYYDVFERSDVWEITILTPEQKKKFESKNKKQTKRWKNSKTYRLNSLYSFDNHKDDKCYWDWVKWEFIYFNPESRIKREGLINTDLNHNSKWCYVNVDNEFEYEGQKYKIMKEVIQYNYNKKLADNTIPDDDFYTMDKILVLEQNGLTHYYDMDIRSIERRYIKLIK